jgi:steroid delta-isomerase-like uncharacterized protein
MPTESNKEIVRRWITGIWNHGDFGLIDELASEAHVFGSPGHGELRGEGFREFVTEVRSAFPDLNNTIENQISEGDIVVTRGITRGTHQGSFGAIAATGKSVAVPWVMFTRIQDGRILEDWELYDGLGMMTQLGVVSPPE